MVLAGAPSVAKQPSCALIMPCFDVFIDCSTIATVFCRLLRFKFFCFSHQPFLSFEPSFSVVCSTFFCPLNQVFLSSEPSVLLKRVFLSLLNEVYVLLNPVLFALNQLFFCPLKQLRQFVKPLLGYLG